MRLYLILPTVGTNISIPTTCRWCQSQAVAHWQTVKKPLRDTRVRAVTAERYWCHTCQRTFRVYPAGVTRAATSQRLSGTAVMLYLLGLSYGAVSLALTALGHPWSKTSVYDAVQAAAARVPGMCREAVFDRVRTAALAGDLTSVRCRGKWLPLGVSVDDLTGQVLRVDALTGEDAGTLLEWMRPIAEQVGAQWLVSDDADSFKLVAAELGMPQQVCKAHVLRNTEALIAALLPLVSADHDGSLTALQVAPTQAVADLEQLGELIRRRVPADVAQLQPLYERYLAARVPRKGEQASLAYRLRLLFLDRWTLWEALTRYRTWRGPQGERIDGTNNGGERGIGWWVKERSRTMRGYKRERSAVNVSRLLAWCGTYLEQGGANLARLLG